MRKYLLNEQLGFTLIEIIMIIMIIGILSMVTMPKTLHNNLITQYQARQILNDIRYAQAMSMSTGQRYRWVKTSATTYQLLNPAGTPLLLPNGSNTFSLTGGVTFGSLTQLPNNLISFDAFGVPYINTNIPGTALTSTATIVVVNGSDTSTISIYPSTGLGYDYEFKLI